MSKEHGDPENEDVPEDVKVLLQAADARCAFGPGFFATQLAGLLRDRCPDPNEPRPLVEVHLIGGDVLDVCHIIGLAPSWLALAVYDPSSKLSPPPMLTELVPYAAIMRVSIKPGRSEQSRIGFDPSHSPFVVRTVDGVGTAEGLLKSTALPDERRAP